MARFSLSTTNVPAFTALSYQLSGIEAEDIENGKLSGSVVVGQDGKAVVAIALKRDLTTEGDETLRIAIETTNAYVVVKDTSRTINYPDGDKYVGDVINGQLEGTGVYTFVNGGKYSGEFRGSKYNGQGTLVLGDGVVWSGKWLDNRLETSVYELLPELNAVDEGSAARFDLVVTNFKSNTAISYTLTGLQAADVVGAQLSGSVMVDAQGRATISVPIAADLLTEGPETLTVSVQGSPGAPGVSASVLINDTSTGTTTPALPTGLVETKAYSVASAQASVRSNDGGTTWTVTTPAGTETLTTFDRLRFSDKTIALDFGPQDSGYKTVTMIGAAFGKGFVSQYFGTGVSLFDSGQTVAQIAQMVVSTGLIESMVGTSNGAWVKHVYKNVVGVNPDAFTEAVFRTYLDNGTYTKASLLELAAGVGALETQIDLVGIRAEGIGYVPFL